MLFFDLTEESNMFETIVASGDGTDISKTIDDGTRRKLEKDNKTVRGHLLNHMSNPLFDLFVTFKYAKLFGKIGGKAWS